MDAADRDSGPTGWRPRFTRIDLAFVALLAPLAIYFQVGSPKLPSGSDIVVNATIGAGCFALALFAWVRYQEARDVDALFETAAFVLACSLVVLIVADAWGTPVGGVRGSASNVAIAFGLALTRAAVGVLLVIGLRAASRRSPRTRLSARAVVTVPTAVLWLTVVGVIGLGTLGINVVAPSDGTRESMFVPLLIARTANMVVFVAATLLYRRAFFRTGKFGYAAMAVALFLAAEGELLANLRRATDTHPTADDLLRFSAVMVALAGMAIQVGRDVTGLRRARRELDSLRNAEIEWARLAERTRVSREIHEGLAQDLAAARLAFRDFERSLPPDDASGPLVTQIDRALADAIEEVGVVLDAFAGEAEARLSIVTAIASEIDDFRLRYRISCSLDARDALGVRVPAAVAREVARITAQALQNVGLHSGAAHVTVTIAETSESLRVAIEDDGAGFDATVDRPGHYGLSGMRERAALLGATVEVGSAPHAGTLVTVWIPHRRLTGLIEGGDRVDT